MITTKYIKKIGVGALTMLLGISILPAVQYANIAKAVEDTTIVSPILGNTVTWDCIYFGSYPQSEITEITDPNTYHILQSSNNWNMDNTLTIDDTKYKRIKKSDAISTGASYNWNDDSTYHYFKFEAIKWRVIDIKNNSAYMVSDVALDTQKYNQEAKSVSWSTSSLRSWLNGYNASKNQAVMDYSSNNFVDTAFTSIERDSLVSTNSDKVTILSEEEMKNTTSYGFSAQDSRICKASAYAQAMGAHQDTFGACNWWTATSGNSNLTARYIRQSGEIYTKGYSVAYAGNAVRVAVTINLNETDHYRYAGTVSSDGTVIEIVTTTAPVSTPTITPDPTQTVKTETPTFTVAPTVDSGIVPTEPTNTTAVPLMTNAPTELPITTNVPTTTSTVIHGTTTNVPATTPTVVPGTTTNMPATTPTVVPEKTTNVPTTLPTVVPTKTADVSSTAPTVVPTQTSDVLTTNDISKGSVLSHTASNAQYRVMKVSKSADAKGVSGTVSYLCPIKKNKTSATIPAKVTINNQTFKVTTIANGAFSGNKKLKKVVIGKNVKKINAKAFKGCKNLSKITIKTSRLTKTSIGKNAFKKINTKAVIKVPSTKFKKYKKFIKASGAAKSVVFKKMNGR